MDARRTKPDGRIYDVDPRHHPAPRPRYSVGDLLAMLWHSRWIWIMSIGLGVGSGWLLTLLDPPRATAMALLMSRSADEPALQAELSILRSDRLLQDVVDRVGAARIAATRQVPAPLDRVLPACWGEAEAACAMRTVRTALHGWLDDGSQLAGGSRVLAISAASPDPAAAAAMAAAVVEAVRTVRQDLFSVSRATRLAPALAKAEQQLAATGAEIARVRAAASVLDIGQDIAAATQEASAVAMRENQLRERQTAVAAELGRSREQLRSTPEQVPYSRDVSSREGEDGTRALLMGLQLDRIHMAELYAPGFPGLAELDRKIALLKQPQPRSTVSASSERRNPGYDALAGRVVALQAEQDALAGQLAEIGQQSVRAAAREAGLSAAAARLDALHRQQDVEQAIVRQLALDVAQTRTQDQLAMAKTDDLFVLQVPSVTPAPFGAAAMRAAAGGLIGLTIGLFCTLLAARRRRVYVVATEAARHLDLSFLARVPLWNTARPRQRPAAALGALAREILDGDDGRAGPPDSVHLVGTTTGDGAAQIGRALAEDLAMASQACVLVVRLATGELESVAPRSPGEIWPRHTAMRAEVARSLSAARSLVAQASFAPSELALGLFGQAATGSAGGSATGVEALPDQVAQLRRSHAMMVVISEAGLPSSVVRRVSALADCDVMVVRARHSRAALALRLRQSLAMAGARPLGFVFTCERSPFFGRPV